MRKFANSFNKIFRTVLISIMAFLTGINVVSIVLQVVFRIFKIRIAWTNELAGISLAWITFLGATLATVDQTHIGFDTIFSKLKLRQAVVLRIICNIFVFFACVVIFWYGLTTVKHGESVKLVSLPGTLAMAVSIVPASAAVMAIATIINSVKTARGVLGGDGGSSEELQSIYDDVPEEVLHRSEQAFSEAEHGGGESE